MYDQAVQAFSHQPNLGNRHGEDAGERGLATIVSLIASTHSQSGLRVRSEIDRRRYPEGVIVTDKQMATVRLKRHAFHGDWNYTIYPAARHR